MQKNTIPLINLKERYLAQKKELDEALGNVLNSGWFIMGEELRKFEDAFSRYLGINRSVGVASGTDALILAMKACGIDSQDLVFTVSHTAVATVAAIELAGANPVLIDIEADSYTMDPNHLEDVIKSYINNKRGQLRPKAIIPVHLYGNPADMESISQIAKRYDLLVIEDCAQSHGAQIGSQKTGTMGDLGVFSFYPTKNLGAFGDGGLIASNNESLIDKIKLLQQYGWRNRYISEIPGVNSRLDEIQAAFLRVMLKYLDEENEKRAMFADIYNNKISAETIELPTHRLNVKHVYHQYVIRVKDRDHLQTFLREKNIGTGIHYPVPIHLQPAYLGRLGHSAMLPNTEKAAREVLSLPINPYIDEDSILYISECINEWAHS